MSLIPILTASVNQTLQLLGKKEVNFNFEHLFFRNNDNFLHLKIVRQLDGQYILGQFSKPFLEIPKVIHHYSINKLNIRGAEHKFLKHPIAVQPRYHTIEPEDEGDINV